MSILSKWLRGDTAKWILKIGQSILRLFIDRVAKDLQDEAWRVVKYVEDAAKSDGTIKDKYQMAFDMIRKDFPTLKESLINHAIESAVLALDALRKGI